MLMDQLQSIDTVRSLLAIASSSMLMFSALVSAERPLQASTTFTFGAFVYVVLGHA
jgi:hypothetical protein